MGAAGFPAGGFAGIDKRFEQVDKRFEKIEGRINNVEGTLSNMHARLGRIESDVEDIKLRMVTRGEYDDLSARVKYIEIKMGIKSGK